MGDAVRTHSLYLLKAPHFVLVLTNTTLLEIHTLVSKMIHCRKRRLSDRSYIVVSVFYNKNLIEN